MPEFTHIKIDDHELFEFVDRAMENGQNLTEAKRHLQRAHMYSQTETLRRVLERRIAHVDRRINQIKQIDFAQQSKQRITDNLLRASVAYANNKFAQARGYLDKVREHLEEITESETQQEAFVIAKGNWPAYAEQISESIHTIQKCVADEEVQTGSQYVEKAQDLHCRFAANIDTENIDEAREIFNQMRSEKIRCGMIIHLGSIAAREEFMGQAIRQLRELEGKTRPQLPNQPPPHHCTRCV